MDIKQIAEQLEESNLKTQALLERVATLTSEYENKVADLRVVVTRLNQQAERYKQQISDMESAVASVPESNETVEGEVVE